MSASPPWQETATPAAPAPVSGTDDGTIGRIVLMILVVAVALYSISLLADYNEVLFFAGKLSLGLFLVGSVWCVGFLLLRTANQAATESYDLEREKLSAVHGGGSSTPPPAIAAVLDRYATVSQRHREITQTRSHSAALTLYGTALAGIAGATIIIGIPGFWALFDFLAILLLLAALVLHGLGSGRPGITGRLDRFLPPRWQHSE